MLDRAARTGHENRSLWKDRMFPQAILNIPRANRAFRRRSEPGRLRIYALLSLTTFLFYITARLSHGPAETLFAMIGAGACGWAWLLTRALFDPARHDARWPRIVAGVVAATGALSIVAPIGVMSRFADSAYALSGSAALLLTFVEPFQTRGQVLAGPERRFRIAFLAVYAALIAISILGLGASAGYRDDLVKVGSAVVGLLAVGAALWFRLRHPLASVGAAAAPRRAPTPEDAALAERLLRLLREEGIDAQPDLKIADVASRLGQPEYKVSQCISTVLGFPNFNRLINHHRIERAKRLLAEHDRPILDVAYDCGFGSVGPFNRAFKAEVGTTPRAFRAASRARRDHGG